MNFNETTTMVVANQTLDLNLPTGVNVLLHIAYLTETTCLLIGSFVLLAPICYYPALRDRKNYVLIGGLMFVNFLQTLPFWLMSVHRLVLMALGVDMQEQVHSVPGCWWLVHNRLFMLGGTIGTLVMSALSLDRLLLTVFPLWHMSQGVGYTWWMLGSIFTHGIVVSLVCVFFRPLDESSLTSRMCQHSVVEHPFFRDYTVLCSAFGALSSVFIFGVNWVIYTCKQMKKVTSTSQSAANVQQQQRQFSKSFGRSTICSLCLVVMPLAILDSAVLQRMQPCDWTCEAVREVCYIVALLNVAADIWIFSGLRELRVGVKALLHRKMMPTDITLWK